MGFLQLYNKRTFEIKGIFTIKFQNNFCKNGFLKDVFFNKILEFF